MQTRLSAHTWSLARQLFALQVVVIAIVVLAGSGMAYLQSRARTDESTRVRVLAIARTVAASPQVWSALTSPDPSAVLQPYAERVRRATGTDFVVVMRPDGTRYSHPNPSLIGKPFIGHIDDAVAGGVVLETYAGTLGPSERAVVPVRSDGGPVIGLVSVGVTRDAVARQVNQQEPTLLGAAFVALLLAAAGTGAALVARRLRRQTHGMGSEELARQHDFYDAVLHSVREGLVLLDLDGRLTLANDEASRLLELPADWAGHRLDELGLPAPMTDALEGGRAVVDAIHLTSSRVLVVNQAPARWEGRQLGTVLTLRDHTDLQALTGELDTARSLTEALRSQAHEAANRLHSVISLIELGRTDQALTFATAELALAQKLTDMVVDAVEEPVLAALLLGKAAEANERGVELQIDPASTVPEGMFPARDLVTMAGNLIDNAIDAAAAAPGPRRVGFSSWIEDAASGGGIASTLVLQVSDSGPGLDDASALHAFTRDWSTKRDERLFGHGLGLALVVQATHRHHGTIKVGRAEVAHAEVAHADVGALEEGAHDGAVLVELVQLVEADFVGAVFTIRLPLATEVAP